MSEVSAVAVRPGLPAGRSRLATVAAAAVTLSVTSALTMGQMGPARPQPHADPAFSLLATQSAIMMNGTFTPDVTPEFAALVMHNYIDPVVGTGYTAVPLRTPESLWPFSGLASLTYNESTRLGYQLLDAKYHQIAAQNAAGGAPDTPMLVFGYSQSAFIASVFDLTLSNEMASGDPVPPTTFFLVGNTNVPNGGLMSRFNGLGLTPWTPVVAAPTDTGSLTYDVFRQYDPFADFPAYPLNALAVVNALMGYLLHFTLPISGNPPWLNPVIKVLNKLITPISLNPDSPNYIEPVVSRYQDTVYQFVPTAKLPILDPLRWLGLSKLADALDPVLRPLIEAGYDRSVSFGVPTPARFVLPPDLGDALRQSWQALLRLIAPSRPVASATAAAPARQPAASVGYTAVQDFSVAATSEALPARSAQQHVPIRPDPGAAGDSRPARTASTRPIRRDLITPPVPAPAAALRAPGPSGPLQVRGQAGDIGGADAPGTDLRQVRRPAGADRSGTDGRAPRATSSRSTGH